MASQPRARPAAPQGRANSREPILRAAAELISRHGVRGLRVEQVAATAGVSLGLIYYHFAGREGLVRATLAYANEKAPSTVLLEEPAPGTTGYEAVVEALSAELDEDLLVRTNNIVWNEVSASAVFDADLRAELMRVTSAWDDAVAAGVRRGVADGSIAADVDPLVAAQLLTSLIDGLSERWLAAVLPLDQARALLRDAVEQLLRPAAASRPGAAAGRQAPTGRVSEP